MSHFWELVVLIVLVWFLLSISLAMYFGHRISVLNKDQEYIDTQYNMERLRHNAKYASEKLGIVKE